MAKIFILLKKYSEDFFIQFEGRFLRFDFDFFLLLSFLVIFDKLAIYGHFYTFILFIFSPISANFCKILAIKFSYKKQQFSFHIDHIPLDCCHSKLILQTEWISKAMLPRSISSNLFFYCDVVTSNATNGLNDNQNWIILDLNS